jgi:zinc transport system ATP-binding protein
MKTLISAQKISYKIFNNEIIKTTDFTINQGEIISIVGPNGGGKTSFVKILMGLLEPSSGKVKRKENLKVGYMPQYFKPSKAMPITVRKFLSLWVGKGLNNYDEIIKLLKLEAVLDKQLTDLSGGWNSKVNFARAFLSQPDLVFLDEPTASFDIIAKNDFYHIIGLLQKMLNCSIVIISHDLSLVMAKTKKVVCFNNHICCEGKPEKISKHPSFEMVFGKQALDEIALYSHYHTHSHG